MPERQLYQGRVYLWPYVPNLPGAIVFAGLFALVTIAHIWKMVRTKMWFCIPFVIGGLCEPIGYACRALSTNNTASLTLFILQSLFILLPPVFFAASLYMVFSRVIRAVHGEQYSLISPRWCTRIFVFGDFVCLNIQSTGGSVAAKPKNSELGSNIIVGGLVLQCVVFVVFMYCCIRFHMRFRSQLAKTSVRTDIPWEPILYMLYATSVLITIRNIFRLIEFIMGKGSYLYDSEWVMYVFDGVLMLIVMVVFFIWYPNQLQMRNTESMIELTSDEAVPGGQGRKEKSSNSATLTFWRQS